MPRFSCPHQQSVTSPCAECNPKEWAKLTPKEREKLEADDKAEREGRAVGDFNASAAVVIDHEAFRELDARVREAARFQVDDRAKVAALDERVTAIAESLGRLYDRLPRRD